MRMMKMSGMTREEAIEIIKNLPVYRAELIYGGNSELAKALGMAIADMEKQIPKKPIKQKMKIKDCIDQIRFFEKTVCPSCGERLCADWKFCFDCGQALDWSEEND